MHIKPPSIIPDLLSSPTAALPFSVKDARDHVAGWTDLAPTRCRDLDYILLTVARMASQPPETVLLTPESLRAGILDRSAAAYGLEESTMRTVLSGLRYVLRRLDVIDSSDYPLIPAWEAQLARLDPYKRAGLITLARFCSACGIEPDAVCAETHQAFEARLAARTLTIRPRKTAGAVRSCWNHACAHVSGWAGQPLTRARDKNQYVLPLSDFPESFQAELATFGQQPGATSFDAFENFDTDDGDGEAAAPLICTVDRRATTIALRQAHARWAGSALVASGVPIDEVTSLESLVSPLKHARDSLRYLFERAGQQPSAAGTHVADVLCLIARDRFGQDSKEMAWIRHWRKKVALKYHGMTEKNERRVREVMQPGRLDRLKQLPDALMDAARQLRATAPRQAYTLALRAVAIGILTRLPIRLANLTGLRLDRHLHRPDPMRGLFSHLLIPQEDMKNKQALSLPISQGTARLIEEWITFYRPTVAPPGCAYLFPGQGADGAKPITHQGMRDAIKGTLRTHVGVELSPHQFRHLAARLFLEAYPGHYEEVRQLLGHKTITTTTRHYSGIESEATARRFDEVILGRRGTAQPQRRSHSPGRPQSARRRGKG